ncbi:MAG: two-component regulator propeller domain-containing protein [Bacteroidota bacterium]
MSIRKSENPFLLIVTLVLSVAVPDYGQSNFQFDQLTTRNGLSSNTVNTVLQDKNGFLWFGTETGLNRFDGYRFKIYQNNRKDSNSLSNNYIWSLCEDAAGNIWIGTDGGGLNKFDPQTETFVRYQNIAGDSSSLSTDIVQSVYHDRKGNLWVGTWDGGVNLMQKNAKSFVRFMHNPLNPTSLSDNKVHFIKEDSEGNIWIGTDGGGLNRFDPMTVSFTSFKHDPKNPRSLSFDMVTDMVEDPKGNLWLTTYGEGLDLFDRRNKTFANYKLQGRDVKASSNVFWKIVQDSKGLLWITTQTEGLVIFNPQTKTFTWLKENKNIRGGLPANILQDVFEDNSGILWITTVGKGIVKTDRNPSEFMTVQHTAGDVNSIPSGFIYSLCEDSNGDILIGTIESGIVRLTSQFRIKKRYPVNTPNGLSGEYARSMFRDSENNLWVGTYYGTLNKLDRKSDTFEHFNLDFRKENPMRNFVRSIMEDSDGTLWFGSHGNGGLTTYDTKKQQWLYFVPSDTSKLALSGYDVLSVREDRKGYLWVGTQSYGLNRIDRSTGTVKKYFHEANNPRSVPDNSVPELFVDSRGNLWIGTTSSGLARYDYETDSFEIFTTEEGLSGNSICGILEDDHGNLWISTMNAITRFNPETQRCDNYNYYNGIRSEEFVYSSRYKTADGRMLFGGTDGITVFHPDSIKERNDDSPILITSFKIFNKEVTLPKNIAYVDTIHLDYTDNFFSFEFASLDYALPERIEYSYILEGVDNNWIDAGRVSFANYTHVDPGNYLFKVRRTNGTTSAEIAVIIDPPFWMTAWFRFLVIFGFLSVGPMIYYRRVTELKREKKRQEEFSKQLINSQEEERKRIASELHDSIGQNLLFIKNSAVLGTNKSDLKRFSDINETASSSIEEVRRIAFNLFPYQLDRLGLTKAIESVVRAIGESSPIQFHSEIQNIDGIFSKEQESSIFRIVQECLNNVIKHSGAESGTVLVRENNGTLLITIGDNGNGFNHELQNNESKGFGLKNIHNRVMLLRGNISFTTSSEFKTLITISLPIIP